MPQVFCIDMAMILEQNKTLNCVIATIVQRIQDIHRL